MGLRSLHTFFGGTIATADFGAIEIGGFESLSVPLMDRRRALKTRITSVCLFNDSDMCVTAGVGGWVHSISLHASSGGMSARMLGEGTATVKKRHQKQMRMLDDPSAHGEYGDATRTARKEGDAGGGGGGRCYGHTQGKSASPDVCMSGGHTFIVSP